MSADPYPALPPVGQIHDADGQANVRTYLENLARESSAAFQRWKPTIDANLNLYAFGHPDGQQGDDKLIVHKIQDAVIAIVDIQTKEPTQVTLEPVETGEPPLYYWAGPPEAAASLIAQGLLMPQEVVDWLDPETGQMTPPLSINPLVAGELKAREVPEEASPALPMGFIRPEWLVKVCDRTVADLYQPVFELFWERSNTNRWIRDSALDTSVQGTAFGLYQFDDVEMRHVLGYLDLVSTYIDPTVRDISEATYAGFDLPIDAAAAKAHYPELAADIEREAWKGQPDRIDVTTQFSQVFNEQVFERPMVTFRVFWLRNQIVPMTKDEAVGAGLVQEVVPYGDEQQLPTDVGAAGETAAGGLGESPVPATADPTTDDEALGEGSPPEHAAGLGGTAPAVEPGDDSAGSCVLIATGEPCAPGSPNWPTRLGIRQITQIGQTVVDDRQCEFFDIPILHNINIPMTGRRPYGIGEPERLKNLQRNYNIILGSGVDHARYFSAPMTWVAQSTHDQLPPQYKNGFNKPGVQLILPDEVVRQTGGKPIGVQDPPPMSAALPQMTAQLAEAIQESSGYTDSLRGIGNPQDSGRKTEMLQNAGSSQISFKASRTADMVRRLSLLMLHELVWRLSPEQVGKIVSKYPPHILEILHARARSIEWDVKVVVHANAGMDFQKQQTALMQYQSGMLSKQTAQEMSRIDPRVEDTRQTSEMQKQARLGMVAGPGQEQQGGEKKKGPPQ